MEDKEAAEVVEAAAAAAPATEAEAEAPEVRLDEASVENEEVAIEPLPGSGGDKGLAPCRLEEEFAIAEDDVGGGDCGM